MSYSDHELNISLLEHAAFGNASVSDPSALNHQPLLRHSLGTSLPTSSRLEGTSQSGTHRCYEKQILWEGSPRVATLSQSPLLSRWRVLHLESDALYGLDMLGR